MNKPLLLLTLAALMAGGIFTAGISHASPITQANIQHVSNATSNDTKANLTSQMTVQIVGYNSAYDLYVTAPSNTTSPMITSFYLNVSSPGASSVSVYFGSVLKSHQDFAWRTIDYINTTAQNGTTDMTVTISSSTTGLTRNLTYFLQFETPVQYVNYAYQKTQTHLQKTVTEIELEATSIGTYIFGGMVGAAFLVFAYFRQSSSRKYRTLRQPQKMKVAIDRSRKGGF